jgi:hypothetical protein
METSLLIAKIIGIIYTSFGLGLLFSRNYYRDAIPKLFESSGYLILGGWLAVVVGILIVEYHNYWTNDWTVIITVIGWLALVKGCIILAFPKMMLSFKSLFTSNLYLNIITPCVLVFGIFLLYLSYFSS